MFSQTVEYALRAVVYLAYEAPEARTTAQIAEATKLPRDYLSKILQGLAKKVLAYHHVRLPRFVVSHRNRPLRRLRRFAYPAFVKPASEESSDGISRASSRTSSMPRPMKRFTE